MIPPHSLGVGKGVGMTFGTVTECEETDIYSVQLRPVLDKQVREIHTFHSLGCTLRFVRTWPRQFGSTERIAGRKV
jgi:hypothetical protein